MEMPQFVQYDAASSATSSHHYFLDNLYANGWGNPKSQLLYGAQVEQNLNHSNRVEQQPPSLLFMDSSHSQHVNHAPPPKLEDFLGDSQTETQDSSLTHIYDHHHGSAYFGGDHQDLKAIAAFQAFSTNSGSEVDDSASIGKTQPGCTNEFGTHSIESSANELAFSATAAAATGTLSLAVAQSSEETLVAADSDSSKKIADTFGQRTSIYRGSLFFQAKGSFGTLEVEKRVVIDHPSHGVDTDGRVDMKRIYGITAVEGRVRLGKGVKWLACIEGALMVGVCSDILISFISLCIPSFPLPGLLPYSFGVDATMSILIPSLVISHNTGGYDKEEKAARAYDLAALKYWGPTATTNFPVSNYTKELEEMKHVTKQEFIASLRRKSSGFSRGASIYRGVTRHHQQGRWQARIGRVAGNKDLYLGTFATEEEAAEAYDIAAIKFRGANAVTNFEMNRYDVEAIMKSSLPVGGAAKRLKRSLESEQKAPLSNSQQNPQCGTVSNSINFSAIHQPVASIPYGIPFDSTTAYYHHNLFQHFHGTNDGTAESAVTSTNATGLTALPTSAAEFFIWPHQSY
ncbi:DNA-binding domain superfamily [Sesbania bispinosa]|nr:DNA-binding domain superfamily [Sesbania bispinosa]